MLTEKTVSAEELSVLCNVVETMIVSHEAKTGSKPSFLLDGICSLVNFSSMKIEPVAGILSLSTAIVGKKQCLLIFAHELKGSNFVLPLKDACVYFVGFQQFFDQWLDTVEAKQAANIKKMALEIEKEHRELDLKRRNAEQNNHSEHWGIW